MTFMHPILSNRGDDTVEWTAPTQLNTVDWLDLDFNNSVQISMPAYHSEYDKFFMHEFKMGSVGTFAYREQCINLYKAETQFNFLYDEENNLKLETLIQTGRKSWISSRAPQIKVVPFQNWEQAQKLAMNDMDLCVYAQYSINGRRATLGKLYRNGSDANLLRIICMEDASINTRGFLIRIGSLYFRMFGFVDVKRMAMQIRKPMNDVNFVDPIGILYPCSPPATWPNLTYRLAPTCQTPDMSDLDICAIVKSSKELRTYMYTYPVNVVRMLRDDLFTRNGNNIFMYDSYGEAVHALRVLLQDMHKEKPVKIRSILFPLIAWYPAFVHVYTDVKGTLQCLIVYPHDNYITNKPYRDTIVMFLKRASALQLYWNVTLKSYDVHWTPTYSRLRAYFMGNVL